MKIVLHIDSSTSTEPSFLEACLKISNILQFLAELCSGDKSELCELLKEVFSLYTVVLSVQIVLNKYTLSSAL